MVVQETFGEILSAFTWMAKKNGVCKQNSS